MKKEGTESKSRSKKVKEGETEDEKTMRETIGKKVIEASEGSKKRLGMHASAAGERKGRGEGGDFSIVGSVSRAIHDARSIGCSSFALFVRNQRQWNSKPMEDSVVDEWNKAIKVKERDYGRLTMDRYSGYGIPSGNDSSSWFVSS